MQPALQIALDFVDLHRALGVAREAVRGGVDWLEVGTPLLKAEGLDAVRQLRAAYGGLTIVCDTKTMDAGRAEMEAAAKAGANVATVLAAAADSTIRECIEAGRNYGVRVAVDLVNVADPVRRAAQAAEWGAALVGVHCPIDQQMAGEDPFTVLREVAAAVQIPVSVAGGINSETAATAVAAGASVVVVGGAISKAEDAEAATRQIKRVMESGVAERTELFKRGGADAIRELLAKPSVPNISDGYHHMRILHGLRPVVEGVHMVGRAVTVRTYPGDWAKPVEAIDHAEAGDVVVIDAGGVPPALWGELATHSALQRQLAGVVIHGAIRDTPEIKRLKFPAFARHITARAGEPKGFGEIGVPLDIDGILVQPGDWVVGDDDGLVVIPQTKAVEIANRAVERLEMENRVRKEITSGSTLGQVMDLYKWEKK
ncbi:MAG: 3-hexulose-6-phosphate synthase [Planctomycetota bacterium]|jgi:3-hexulose-6-phosphate synthase/6-phospho-3-hexuloisomerase